MPRTRTNVNEQPSNRSGQTAYKRALAYQCLGIKPEDVRCMPFFRASLRRIARLLNRPRRNSEPRRAAITPFDCLQASDHPDACTVSRAYRSVPRSFRRLLPPEAFCFAAGVSESRVLELIAGATARYYAEASAVVAAVWHPRVVEKTIERALQDDGVRERMRLHKAVGFI
jgi:hypothetical protein